MAVLLELDRVDKSYGALRVADGITLDVADGEAPVSYTHLTLPTILRV